ncbi:MAG TPA: ATP-binding protein [Candidatus Absconditabacterales bacterium]|nr:ATP-binding protein [Candidatus Absconditabacterales bacterium]
MKNFIKKINKIGINIDLSKIQMIDREEYDNLKNTYLKGDKTKWKIDKNEEIQDYQDNMYKIFKYQIETIGTIDMAQKTLGNMFSTLGTSNEELAINDTEKDLTIKYYLISIYLHILSCKHKKKQGIEITDKDLKNIKVIISNLFGFIITNYDIEALLSYEKLKKNIAETYTKNQINIFEEIKEILGESESNNMYKELYYDNIFRNHKGKDAIKYFHELFNKNKEEFKYVSDFVLFNTILNTHKYSFFATDITNKIGIKKNDLDDFYKRDIKILDFFEKRIIEYGKFSKLYIGLSYAITLGHYKRFFENNNITIIDNFKKLKNFLLKNIAGLEEEERILIKKHTAHISLLIIYLYILESIKKININKIDDSTIEGLFKLIKTKQKENQFDTIQKMEKSNNDNWLCNYIRLMYLYTRDTLRFVEIERLFEEFNFISENPQRSIINLYNLVLVKHFNRRLNMIKDYNAVDEKTLNKIFISLLKQEETNFRQKTNEEAEIIELLNKYESNKIEFKSSFCVNIHELIQKKNKEIIGEKSFYGPYLKTIVAFLNSGGGEVVLGVWEEKSFEKFKKDENIKDEDINYFILEKNEEIPGKYILGLGYDMTFKNIDEEGIQRIFDQTIHKNLDPNPVNLGIIIECKILDFFGKKIAKIIVPASKEPVYLKTKTEEIFYIRQNGQSIPIKGREMAEYQRKHFSK